MSIPFNRPFFIGAELDYIAQTVENGMTAGDGPFTERCQQLMEARLGCGKTLLTHSCTAALEMAAILADIGPGDEVILPSYTFVSTANAFFLRGARLVFVDIRPDNLNLDESRLADLTSADTKVIVPVHYNGVGCDMDTIMMLARERNLLVVEDAAQGVGARYRGRYLGTIGHMGAYSFHETKSVISGEGGALVLNDERFTERAEIIREKGTNRTQFFRGEVDKYTWVDVGSSYLPSDIIAAFLYAQLERMDEIIARRKAIYDRYFDQLAPLAEVCDFEVPGLDRDNDSEPGYGMFYILLADEAARNRMIEHLRARGIQAVFHYVPLHLSPVGRRMGYKQGDLPQTESLSGRVLRLPFFYALTPEQQDEVVLGIRTFFSA